MKPLEVSDQYYSSCGLEQKVCIGWAMEYFKDCLCNLNDEISFGLGIASLVCWGVAEIPQILTIFYNKSADGVSLAFISTWIVGDVFNLIGCILEPATLPTQYYTALLYTATTIVLALQCLYYDYFLRLWKRYKSEANKDEDVDYDYERIALTEKVHDRRRNASKSNVPIQEVPQRKDFYFISARSLAGSDNSSIQSYIMPKSGPPDLEHLTDQSSSEDENDNVTLTSPLSYPRPLSLPRPIPRPVGYGTFLAASAYLPRVTKGSQLRFMGRKLQQKQELRSNATYGQCLGWLMAGIYMGGRLPQIWLNFKRGSVEGLNPLMFIFALIANATYVGSILVRSTEWEKIKANMPWLLDALVCVALDLFIILQYIFYRFIQRKMCRPCGQRFGEYYQHYAAQPN